MAELIEDMTIKYEDYLSDESKLHGFAKTISFPKTEHEVQQILAKCQQKELTFTIQGGKTGICGGAVPNSEHVINLAQLKERLWAEKDAATGNVIVEISSGFTLLELHEMLRKKEFGQQEMRRIVDKKLTYCWLPDPTEESATIGGILATNANGPCSKKYGGLTNHIQEIRVLLPNGEILEIPKDRYLLEAGQINLPNGQRLPLENQQFATAFSGDLLDLFIGSEGLYGVILSAKLIVVPQANQRWIVTFFFENELDAGTFAQEILIAKEYEPSIAAIEFMDDQTISLLDREKYTLDKIKELPDVAEQFNCLVYVEIHEDSEEAMLQTGEWLIEKAMENHSDVDASWVASELAEIDRLHAYRHGAPELINRAMEGNQQKCQMVTKLATDYSIMNAEFSLVLASYREILKMCQMPYFIFGHMLNGHLHVNFLPENEAEIEESKVYLNQLAEFVLSQNGQLASEHGLGKLKASLLNRELFVAKQVAALAEVKDYFDPTQLMNPGNQRWL